MALNSTDLVSETIFPLHRQKKAPILSPATLYPNKRALPSPTTPLSLLLRIPTPATIPALVYQRLIAPFVLFSLAIIGKCATAFKVSTDQIARRINPVYVSAWRAGSPTAPPRCRFFFVDTPRHFEIDITNRTQSGRRCMSLPMPIF